MRNSEQNIRRNYQGFLKIQQKQADCEGESKLGEVAHGESIKEPRV